MRREWLTAFLRRALWGSRPERPTYALTRWVFLRLLGVVYLVAFASLFAQLPGLIGSNGILPAREFLPAVRQYFGEPRCYGQVPTLFWLDASDAALRLVCGGGMALAGLLIVGVAPMPVLVLLWAFYLSLVHVGQDFLSFQWDALLLETGLLAVFFAPRQLLPRPSREGEPPTAWLLLLRWLLFRLMFLSGVTKLTYNDPTWWDLTALNYHYWTQPLPTLLGWYAHHLPEWFQKLSCLAMFAIEIGVPFLIFAPRRLRLFACFALVFLQVLIAATGNYGFFNLLALLLCVLLLDDGALKPILPRRLTQRFERRSPPAPRPPWRKLLAAPLIAVLVAASTLEAWEEIRGRASLPAPAVRALSWVRPFNSINGYGLFRVMTTSRPEIMIEGSYDGVAWLEYGFRWKPGDRLRPPRWNAPHQPRLDWQMWFAALEAERRMAVPGGGRGPRWLLQFVGRLLQGSPPVLGLLETNPFADRPPRYVRAILYEYRYTSLREQRETGRWWTRQRLGVYLPSVSLRR